MHKSLPELPSRDSASDSRKSRGSHTRTSANRRSSSFGTRKHSVIDLLKPPVDPEMPASKEEEPDYYSRCMRLLLLASAMKSFDVVVLLGATDDENVRLFNVVSDMRLVLKYVTRRKNEIEGRPQVLVALLNDSQRRSDLEQISTLARQDPPLVIPRRAALPSLVCEVSL